MNDQVSTMTAPEKKPLMRSLGEFVGHIVKAVRTDPTNAAEVRRDVEEEQRGDVTLRRTTIEEIEIRPPGTDPEA